MRYIGERFVRTNRSLFFETRFLQLWYKRIDIMPLKSTVGRAESDDQRVELDQYGVPHLECHRTKGKLTCGLAGFFEIGGQPAAVCSSSGPNKGDHRMPKKWPILVPMPTDVRVMSGDATLELGGQAVAHRGSQVKVPDVTQPVKSEVLKTENDWFLVNGSPVICGSK